MGFSQQASIHESRIENATTLNMVMLRQVPPSSGGSSVVPALLVGIWLAYVGTSYINWNQLWKFCCPEQRQIINRPTMSLMLPYVYTFTNTTI